MKTSKQILLGMSALVLCVLTGVAASMWAGAFQKSESALPSVARANTSDRVDGYLTCTGYVEPGIEAVYTLDSTTGVLFAGVLSRNTQTPGFQARYQGNVNLDLQKAVDFLNKSVSGGTKKKSSSSRKNRDAAKMVAIPMPTEAKYIMTAGTHDIISQGQTRPGMGALYVTEVNTGVMMIYLLPWNPTMHSSNSPLVTPITYYTIDRVLTPMVTEESVEEE